LPQEPGKIFGGLLGVCVRDDYVKDKVLAEEVLFIALGACSSLVTTYLLSVAGVLV
jgi:hypothetical protein